MTEHFTNFSQPIKAVVVSRQTDNTIKLSILTDRLRTYDIPPYVLKALIQGGVEALSHNYIELTANSHESERESDACAV